MVYSETTLLDLSRHGAVVVEIRVTAELILLAGGSTLLVALALVGLDGFIPALVRALFIS